MNEGLGELRVSKTLFYVKVLLLGIEYDKNTFIHLADVRAEYLGRHDCVEYSAILENE